MNGAPDEYRLEEIAFDHRIGASVFIPFVIARLQGEGNATEAVLTVTFSALSLWAQAGNFYQAIARRIDHVRVVVTSNISG